MVLCFRCKMSIAKYECELCSGFFCLECDKFIHSNYPKNNHIRKVVENLQNLPKLTNFNNNIIDNQQKIIQKKDQIEINSEKNNNQDVIEQEQIKPGENNQNDKEPNINEIKEQNNSNIQNVPSINEFNPMNTYNSINLLLDKCKSSNLGIRNYFENINLNNEKDEEIEKLQKTIEAQRDIISKLKIENNSLEELIEEDNVRKEQLYQEKERIFNKRRKIEEFYNKKLDEIQKIHELEKYKLIEDFENQMRNVSSNYINQKANYINSILDMEKKMKEYQIRGEEEKKEMYDEIDRLKKEGIKSDKEQEFLIKSNDDLNSKLEETNNNMVLLRRSTLKEALSKSKSIPKNKSKIKE